MEEDKTQVTASQLEEEDAQASAEPAQAVNGEEAEGNQVKEDEHSSRMSAAKAFYRALYAGEETTGKPDMSASTSINPRGQDLDTCANCQATEELLMRADSRASEAEALYKRMAADFDNYRKRTDRERDELYTYGMQKAVEALLPALDDLDRAQTSFTEAADARSVLESLKLVYSRFAKCLEQLGIKPLESVGQIFDPRLHEPVQQVHTDEVPEGQVVHDLRRGYAMGEKVIRPSLVNVAIGANADSSNDNTTTLSGEELDKPVQSDYPSSSRSEYTSAAGAARSVYALNEEDEQETQELPIISRKNRPKQSDKHKSSDQANSAEDVNDSERSEIQNDQDAGADT